ncbi:hypothetical protein CLU79DRAFT_758926 [Phycomyces nitens]|nr:hypothetical protein CLU79DRAFT_758926 [Phycomyces nitens]
MSSNSQIALLHSQAACVFFCWGEDLNPENELLCKWKIDALPHIELCYINDIYRTFSGGQKPHKFFLLFRYQLYRRGSSEEANMPSISISNQHIHCESQFIDFDNIVFLITDPRNEPVYERKELSLEETFKITAQYTTLYEKKKPATFTYFATKNGAQFLKAKISRERMDSGHRVEQKIIYIYIYIYHES